MERVILHVDGDGFFAGCEVARNPLLKGMPVVVGRERGMVIAMTEEAKVSGVKRGMTLHEARRICPNIVTLDGDHELYSLFSGRMNKILERFSTELERYSVDESFADITTMDSSLRMSHEDIAQKIKETLKKELGMTFSIGIAPTKVLAKLGSKHRKPDGLTVIKLENIHDFLKKTPIENIWGIGPSTSAYLQNQSIFTAHDFTERSESWINTMLAKPYQDIWRELRGVPVLPLHTGLRKPYQSLLRTRTFTPPTNSEKFLLAELSRHTEVVCARARKNALAGKTFSFFLKTQEFKFQRVEFTLSQNTNIPEGIIELITKYFPRIYDEEILYRASGVTLSALAPAHTAQQDLFDTTHRALRLQKTYVKVDSLNEKFKESVVHLAGSTHIQKTHKTNFFTRDEEFLKRLNIPHIGTIG